MNKNLRNFMRNVAFWSLGALIAGTVIFIFQGVVPIISTSASIFSSVIVFGMIELYGMYLKKE